MDHILMLLCFLIMVATLPVSAATVNGRAMLEDAHEKRDVEALLSFKKHIKSDPSARLSDWTAENSQNVCSWHGITCREHTIRFFAVILLVLVPFINSNLRLEGTLFPSLDNLS